VYRSLTVAARRAVALDRLVYCGLCIAGGECPSVGVRERNTRSGGAMRCAPRGGLQCVRGLSAHVRGVFEG